MRICVAMDHKFDRAPDGSIWTSTTFPYEFFKGHYLSAFDDVRVIARLNRVDKVQEGSHRADGPGVSFAPIPLFRGPAQYLLKRGQVGRAIRENVGPDDAVLARVPSTVCNQMLKALDPGRPFAVHVVGDPWDVFSPGASHHPLRAFFRRWFTNHQKRQCERASAAAYVTKAALQRRYPCPNRTTNFSCVKVDPEVFVDAPRPRRDHAGRFRLITVGSLEHLYKSQDVQIEALARCVRGGLDLELAIAGDGKYRPMLESLAKERGVADRVHFLGLVPGGAAVRRELDASDLFVLPSRQEGLPRAMIEAMARALPCIGSTVGGIPELVPTEDVVEPGDIDALAAKFREVLSSPERMARMSARNLKAAEEYREDLLHPRRVTFYKYVREVTEAWLARR
jgi:glycosyltransferase involved in cell wall biosynthesis